MFTQFRYFFFSVLISDEDAIVNMNVLATADQSLWINKADNCKLNGTSTAPHFVPKVNEVSLVYNEMSRKSSGMYLLTSVINFLLLNSFYSVTIKGKLLISCGLRVEARVGSKESEEYMIVEIEEWSTEEEATVTWPASYEDRKDVDWFIRVLYGENMKLVRC
jgi:hypothetical protein